MQKRLWILGLLAGLLAGRAHAICDVIPGVTQTFRGALGSVDRPFAIPGDAGQQLAITLAPAGCDAASPGFLDLPGGSVAEDDYFVTLLFEPPEASDARNAVILSTPANLASCQAQASGVVLPGGGAATCRPVTPGTQELSVLNPATLTFRFPDTDAEVDQPDDDHTYTGPTTIAVTPTSDPLPFGLATARCADTAGLVACIDELYTKDGTCATTADHVGTTFSHFTALPPANDYQSLCITDAGSGGPCLPTPARELRFTLDAAGNALVPIDYRGVLVVHDRIPIPRLVRGVIHGAAATNIPSDTFVASFAPGGQRLPPIFTPITDPDAPDGLAFFGSVDAPVGVIRIQRQGCNGGPREGAACSSDAECGPGDACTTLFDFSLGDGGVGPAVLAETEFTLTTENPVPLDGLIESGSMFAFVTNEAIDQEQLNDDSDTTDPVIRLRARQTAQLLPIGSNGASGRAVTRVRDGRFRFPAVAVEDDLVAFLELEPLEGDCASAVCDKNGNGSVFEPILRLYRVDPGAGTADSMAPAVIAVDPSPLVNGRSLAISEGLVYFRTPEGRNAQQLTERVSVDSSGQPGNLDSGSISLSGDGRLAAFLSLANDLVSSDGNGAFDVFVRDRILGVTERVNVRPDGGESVGDGPVLYTTRPAISADGTVVAFESGADDLVVGDTNGEGAPSGEDIFVRDLTMGITERVNVDSTGQQGDGARASHASISADGQIVAFDTGDSTLVPGDTNGVGDVFVHDRITGQTERVSVGDDGMGPTEANENSSFPALSGDGLVVAFDSLADNLVPGDTNTCESGLPCKDVFVHDRGTQLTERVSVDSLGNEANNPAERPSLSRNGQLVAFGSHANALVAGDTNDKSDVFVHDRATGLTERVSLGSDGRQAGGHSSRPSLSGDGHIVAFESDADDLVPGDSNGLEDVFVHDRRTGATDRVSVGMTAQSHEPWVAANGQTVGFAREPDGVGPWELFVRGPDLQDLTADLTGDDDLDDTVLEVLDTGVFPVQRRTLLPATQVVVAAGSAAFLVPEASDGVDRNSDGDTDDAFVHLSVVGGAAQDLGKEAVAIAMSAEIIAALVPSGPSGETFVEVYDWSAGAPSWTSVGAPEARSLEVAASTVAFVDGTGDLNLYDAASTVLTPLDLPGQDVVLGERLVAFRVSEVSQGASLNVDPDVDDDVLFVFDLVSQQLFNTGNAVIPCPLEACDPRFPYRVEGDTVTYITAETEQGGQDLNGDGDATDLVKQLFNAREAALLASPIAPALMAVASMDVSGSVRTIAAASAGICTTTGDACATDAECAGGTCYLPPGACVLNLGTACTCNESSCSGCAVGEFCVATSNGNGICHQDLGPCVSQTPDCDDLDPDAVCTNAGADIQRLFAPIGGTDGDGETVFSSGTCAEVGGGDRQASCLTDADCETGHVCVANLTIVGAADTDRDDLADPFDNCPGAANTDQADLDGDGIGDACDLQTCGNGIQEYAEGCDHGAASGMDGVCDADCQYVGGGTACSDGIDNDGDGEVDGADIGCSDGADTSERDPAHVCDDGIDNDGDYGVDYPGDPGCKNPDRTTEAPACNNGIDDDGDGKVDYDGAGGLYEPDPQCGNPYKLRETKKVGCGLGFELAPLLIGMALARSRRGVRDRRV